MCPPFSPLQPPPSPNLLPLPRRRSLSLLETPVTYLPLYPRRPVKPSLSLTASPQCGLYRAERKEWKKYNPDKTPVSVIECVYTKASIAFFSQWQDGRSCRARGLSFFPHVLIKMLNKEAPFLPMK